MNPTTGTPVVLLHALPLSSSMWQAQEAALRERGYTVLVPDQRGFGAAPLGDEPPSIDLAADDLARLLDEQGHERAVLVGSSMGGYVALAFLRKYRDRVRGLALLSTRATADSEQAATERRAFASMMLDDGLRDRVVAATTPRLLGATTRQECPGVLAEVTEAVAAAQPAAVAWAQRAIADRTDTTAVLAAAEVPVLVVAGDEDELVTLQEAAELAAVPPLGRLVTIAGAGHLQPLETPQAVTDAVLDLLARVEDPARDADHRAWGHTASTGLGFTSEAIVASHFDACEPYYRAALDKAGIEPGWHVLDAGCGGGTFFPWLTELVGPRGRISAVDLAPENVTLATRRAEELGLGGRVEVTHSDLLALPYADDTFDAVWCSNTTQYLDDASLAVALKELSRVVRPGGLVAIKDLAADLITIRPGDPFLAQDFFRRAAAAGGYAAQLLRSRDLYRYLSEAGLEQVRQETVLMEHHAPMPPVVLEFYGKACASIAGQAAEAGVGAGWEPFADPADPAHPLRSRYGYISEGSVLALGVVPG